ncbi:ABC transporter permease [Proteinivorax tanatarense]|uniref:Transport permease protein n=1 Tax=Proteinivorax tanatarense TaxID=1260629 RepID=A0AAU7VJC7_9FIRM
MKLIDSYINDGKVIVNKDTSLINRVTYWIQGFLNIAFIRWANVRNEWYFHLLIAPLLPLGVLVFMKFSGAIDDLETALYITSGNVVLSLVLGPMQSICNDLAWGRQRNDLDFYSVLPISKMQLILGITSISTLFSIPGMLMVLLVGKVWLGFEIVFHPIIIAVIILSGLAMVGLGVIMGVYARNGHHANVMNSITIVIVTFLSPVLIPLENLPKLIQYTSYLFPTSYAANAFRSSLKGIVDMSLYLNILALIVFIVITFSFIIKKIDWRIE